MTDPLAFDGKRQRAVIRKLARNAGLEQTELAQAVGLSYPQLLRYAYGKVPLRTFQLAAFARAFGVDPLDLAAELGGADVFEDQTVNPDRPVWNFRDALRCHLTEDLIEQLAPQWEGRPITHQQAAVEAFKAMAAQARADATSTLRHQGNCA